MLYYDTETCGLHGAAVTIQYALDDGPVHIWHLWTERVDDTLQFIESMMYQDLVGFNLAFDHFHLCKIYNMFRALPDDAYPVDNIARVVENEDFRLVGGPLCLRPKSSTDLMIIARKGKYQSLMDRKPIIIKKVPTVIAEKLCEELNDRIILPDLLFKRRHDPSVRFVLQDVHDREGKYVPSLKNLVLVFAPSMALKDLVSHIFKLGAGADKFAEVELKARPVRDCGWAPLSNGSGIDGWSDVIMRHIYHWQTDKRAIKYAENDIVYTRMLHEHLSEGCDGLIMGDYDSELTSMVAAVRLRGFHVDIDAISRQRDVYREQQLLAPKAPRRVKEYLGLDERELAAIGGSTSKGVLKGLTTWVVDCDCVSYKGDPKHWELDPERLWDRNCPVCAGVGHFPHPVVEKAKAVLSARTAAKNREVFDKILESKRFHASFKVCGALSNRMSGTDGLNPQGIKNDPAVRACFTFISEEDRQAGWVLSGGDMDSYEVTIFLAVAQDSKLLEQVQAGKKVHALFGLKMFPEMDYEGLLADKEKYGKAKSGLFAKMYGGGVFSYINNLGLTREQAERTEFEFNTEYPGVGEHLRDIELRFSAMQQEGERGRIFWNEPTYFVSSLNGHKRWFDTDYMVMKILYDLANSVPAEWRKLEGKIERTEGRIQTVGGAVQTALYASAFAIQARIIRVATNHEIQSTGAVEIKKLQLAIWSELQPVGVHEYRVMPFNVHDEVICPNTCPDEVDAVVQRELQRMKGVIPLCGMTWNKDMKSWAEK